MPPIRFHPQYLREDFSNIKHYFEADHEIVAAAFFKDGRKAPEEYENKAIVGTFLSLTKPENNQTYAARIDGKDKKMKLGPKPSAIMMVFGDYFNPPNCFCIFVEKKIAFQRLFGHSITRCESVRIGDVFVIKDPEPSMAMLGESLLILRDPVVMGVVVNGNWPTMIMSESTEANHQVFFNEGGKRISVTKPELIRWGDVAKCGGFTCDRQAHCSGCFGAAATRKPIVMTCAITVEDTPNYGFAQFRKFSSLRFTNFFFKDLEGLSGKHISVLSSMYLSNKTSILAMISMVNGNGGWNVCGWHRQGVRTETAGEQILNGRTGGISRCWHQPIHKSWTPLGFAFC
jgi:hypothetical protein